jgi:hypothetical protein
MEFARIKAEEDDENRVVGRKRGNPEVPNSGRAYKTSRKQE